MEALKLKNTIERVTMIGVDLSLSKGLVYLPSESAVILFFEFGKSILMRFA